MNLYIINHIKTTEHNQHLLDFKCDFFLFLSCFLLFFKFNFKCQYLMLIIYTEQFQYHFYFTYNNVVTF
jgi:hypothetical protein